MAPTVPTSSNADILSWTEDSLRGSGGSVVFVWVAPLLERRMAVVCTAAAVLIGVEGAPGIYMGGAAVMCMGDVAVILHEMICVATDEQKQ